MRSNYFKIQELVSRSVYKKYGEKCWEFIDDKLIITIDSLREFFEKPITINNWLWNGNLEQRGLRTNIDEIVLSKTNSGKVYVSQHCLGKAVDFNVKGIESKDVFNIILQNKDKFPYIRRIEDIKDTPTWVHIDIANTSKHDIVIFSGS